ncbi:FAD-binding oxidoreductase [Streptomyces sp. TRM66268-LWL]|uniref:FAD-binding oxidoreductase n=1 Tax=Streptomyces polyasparticus TaxID=2767826 RepID=A0ABR7SX96_9ACTN|nr:FAD-binding oxidoreductase [Streptomyces polyasparticus]MBC9719156.1 FAD-binding oxidoreductase [Streptomyces polyasparticus]
MDRRTALIGGASLALAATATACSGPEGGSEAPATSPSAPPTGGKQTGGKPTGAPPSGAGWSALASDLDGELIRPSDADWDTARQLYNTRFDGLKPAAVAYVAGAEDIRAALAFARRTGTPVAVRGGGHSYAGWSSGDGRLILDVSRLSAIRASAGSAAVGAGARLIDVYRALAAKGATVPAGSCPSVGIAGLALGGGHGVTSRAYGLTCDSLTSATLVTADGEERVCSGEENTDLFWALRGAGAGQFGVVTELRFRTHPAPQAVTCFLRWPGERAGDVVRAWQQWGPEQPDEIWSACDVGVEAGSPAHVQVVAYSLGTYGELQNAVDRLADAVGSPASTVSLQRRSYVEAMEVSAGCAGFGSDAQCHLPGELPGRAPEGALRRDTYAARSDFLSRALPPQGIAALAGSVSRARGLRAATIALTALGGAVNRVDPTATAFVHRGQRMLVQYIASWRVGGSASPAKSWLDTTQKSLRPFTSGWAYQNYTDPTLKNWREAYYGPAADRLTRLKHEWDPDRVFTFPQAL